MEKAIFPKCDENGNTFIPAGAENIDVQDFSVPELSFHLKNITVSEENNFYSSYDGVLYDKDFRKLIYCPRRKENITIHKDTKIIGKHSFALLAAYDHCQISEVIIPDGVKIIEDEAFFGCESLNKLVIPKSVESVGTNSFECCIWLDDISIYGVNVSKWDMMGVSSPQYIVRMIACKDYDVKMHGCYKNPVIFKMMFNNIDGAYEYVKKNFIRMFKSLIKYSFNNTDKECIKNTLASYDLVTAKNVDKLIDYAAAEGKTKIQKMLEDYKNNL